MSEPERLRVTLMNFGYWPEVQRGNERIVHDLAVGLARRGHATSILTSHPGRPARNAEEGVKVVRLWRPPDRLLRRRRIQENVTHVPFSYLELLRHPPDVAHAFYPTDALASTRWAARSGRPALLTLTGIPGRENVSNVRLRLRVLELATTASDEVLVLSEAAREGAWRWLGIESRVIYPGVDLSRFGPGEPAPWPTIACAADPDDQRKRVPLLVRAFARVRRDRPNAELLLLRPRDHSLAQRLEAEPGVRLVPPGVAAAVEMFRTAWVSALCSYNEAFGLVLIESLACGTPVVGADDGAIPEIVDRPEVGRLFTGDDELGVARKLLETLELAQDRAARERCRDRARDFSVERSAEAHEALYRELLAR